MNGANKAASIEEQAGTACLPENVDDPHALPEVRVPFNFGHQVVSDDDDTGNQAVEVSAPFLQ